MTNPTDKQQLKHHKAYWKLVNALDELCWDSVDEKKMWMDDIISALDRVRSDFVKEQIKFQLQSESESEKTPEEEDDLPEPTPENGLIKDSKIPSGIAGDKLRYIG